MKVLRVIASFVGNWLTAVIGTAIWSAGLYRIFHARTVGGVYLKEIFLSAVIAFLLGYFVFYRWKSVPAKWVWVVGVVGLAWRATLRSPTTPGETVSLYSLDWTSVRAIFYSLGAWSCGSVAPLVRRRWSGRP